LEQAFLSARNPAGGDMEALQDRLGLLERALQAEISITRSAVEALAARPAADIAPLMERLDSIDDAAAKEQERAKAAEETLAEGLKALGAGLERQAPEIASLLSGPLNERLDALTSNGDTRHAALNEGLTEAHRRLGALEEALARLSEAENAAQEARTSLRGQVESLTADFRDATEANKSGYLRLADGLTTDLSELHDGIAKLGANQNDLANTLDAEAQDIAATIAALTARIQSLEAASAKPIEMLAALSATVEKIHKTTVEKYDRRNRFWYWLFGTTDWLAASWPSQSARIADELRDAKR
jgi:predicted  nucleic acid-binding Zn-ribbon protein